eukprot:Rhum_TRINITY_DN13448_c0_g1::Rhum_TRINITY_DN13448_c0_g1_i2::g.60255::m.60255
MAFSMRLGFAFLVALSLLLSFAALAPEGSRDAQQAAQPAEPARTPLPTLAPPTPTQQQQQQQRAPCSAHGAHAATSSVSWPPPAHAANATCVFTLALALRDAAGLALCTPSQPVVFAFVEGAAWAGTSAVAGGGAAVTVRTGVGAGDVRVVLGFERRTTARHRGGGAAPGCVYEEIAKGTLLCEDGGGGSGEAATAPSNGSERAACPANVAQAAVSGVWRNTSSAQHTNGTWEWLPAPCRLAAAVPAGAWVVFWGDETLQVAVRNLALMHGAADPFPGDRRAKHYLSREVDGRNRHGDVRLPGGGRLTYVGNTQEALRGRAVPGCRGLRVVQSARHRAEVAAALGSEGGGGVRPDAVVLHSGIADLCVGHDVAEEAVARADARRAAEYWGSVVGSGTRVVLPTTVATAGFGVCHRFHAARVQWWDAIRLEEFKRVFPEAVVVDLHSLTLPFHRYNDYSDGTNYGIENVGGKQSVQRRDFPKDSRFMAAKRYNPTVGRMLARLLVHAAVAADK